jgi:hypothetical protein
VLAFQVIDSLDGNSARREYAGHMPGVIRPLLHWTTQFSTVTGTAGDGATSSSRAHR